MSARRVGVILGVVIGVGTIVGLGDTLGEGEVEGVGLGVLDAVGVGLTKGLLDGVGELGVVLGVVEGDGLVLGAMMALPATAPGMVFVLIVLKRSLVTVLSMFPAGVA